MVHLAEEDCQRLDQQGWAEELGLAPYVRLGRGSVLNQRPDGSCVFLDANNRCRIHTKYGEDAKPLACRVFPFSLRPVARGWQASLRFDCPSAALSKGEPLGRHRAWLSDLAERLDHGTSVGGEVVNLQRGLAATPDELDGLVTRFVRWLKHGDASITTRLIGAARVTTTL
ncbi:MAG: YkgJ family cysteine cluster protein, partial [Planctomycetes bacterium]|nr:YkgJ family cysteine cluster protein [Planctomycetota bacterium]